jgi:hypothetical protein
MIVLLAWKSALPPEQTMTLLYVAMGVFVLLLLLVCVLVIFFPKKLTFDQEAHLAVLRERLGDNEFPATYVPGALPGIEPVALLESKKDE